LPPGEHHQPDYAGGGRQRFDQDLTVSARASSLPFPTGTKWMGAGGYDKAPTPGHFDATLRYPFWIF
jgi:hypothetical protein